MRYQLCVSGSAFGLSVERTYELAFEVGKSIASEGATLLTGATVGLPHQAAMGFKSVKTPGGSTVGFSPASSYREHVATYRLPTNEFDYINFTGMEYVGRDVHLVRSSDALITIGGRMGSLHELATALEAKRVCAVLVGSGGLADFTKQLTKHIPSAGSGEIIYDMDPKKLVQKVIKALDERYADL